MAERVSGGELLARTLRKAGVSEVFSLHGGHLDAFLVACADNEIRLTDTRHEASAGHAAEAYARASGKIGVCVVTAGPGFTNAYTAMANAFLDRMPVLFIVGAPSSREGDLNTLQGGIDQVAAASHVTKWAYRVTSGARLPEILEQAVRRATTGAPGPVVIEVPIEVMFTPTAVPERLATLSNFGPDVAPAPPASQVQAVLTLLALAERPVLIAGGGALLSRSADALVAFAEATNTPVVTAQKAEGMMPCEHPMYGASAVSVPVAAAMGQVADLVVLLGVRVGLFTGGRYGVIPKDAKVVQIDIDGAEPGRGGPVDLAIMADARETLLALTAGAKGREWRDRNDWATMLRGTRHVMHRRWAETPVYSEKGYLHPFHAAKALADALPHDAVIVLDGGESSVWMRDHITPRGAGAFHMTGYLGTLGVGQGFAIGAARAFPDRPVFLFSGDGGVGFHLQEFDAMARHGLPIVTVVLNNACWGMSQNGQDLIYGKNRRAIVELADSNYERVAEAFGGYGARVTQLEDIAPTIDAALASGKPACINLRIDDDVINPVTLAMVGAPQTKPATGNTEGSGENAKAVVMPYYENVE